MTLYLNLKKTTTQVTGRIVSDVLPNLTDKEVTGYEIHMGVTTLGEKAKSFVEITTQLDEKVSILDGAISDNGKVFGSYIHGIFDDMTFTRALLNEIREEKGLDGIDTSTQTFEEFKEIEYEKLADVVRKHVDIEKVYEIVKGW